MENKIRMRYTLETGSGVFIIKDKEYNFQLTVGSFKIENLEVNDFLDTLPTQAEQQQCILLINELEKHIELHAAISEKDLKIFKDI